MPSTQTRRRSSRPRPRPHRYDSSDSSSDSSVSRTQKPKPRPTPQRHDSDITGSDGSSYVDSSKNSHKSSPSDSDDSEPSHHSKHSQRRSATLPVPAKYKDYEHARQLVRRPRGYSSDDERSSRNHRRRHRSPSTSSSSSSSSESDSEEKEKEREERKAKKKQAIQAALTAGAVEAWRTRGDPGGVSAKKVMRIAGAAIAAGGLDALMMQGSGHQHLAQMAEAIVGGLAASSTLGGKITHRREGGAKGKAADSLIAVAASKMMERVSMEGSKGGSQVRRSKSLGPEKSHSSRSHHRR